MSPAKKSGAGKLVLPHLAKPLFARVGIVGFGLIGSSVARALRETGAAGEIHAFDGASSVLRQVQNLSLADRTHLITKGKAIDCTQVPELDLLLLATPLSAYEAALTPLVPCLTKRTIVSDVGSVKGGVADLARLLPSPELLVPAHPLAGTEKSGPAAGFSTLFLDRYCLVVPHKNTAAGARNKVVALWRAFGSRVEIVSAEEHDRILGLTSHLPHAVSYALVFTALHHKGGVDDDKKIARYSASGFRDFTRIAASDPVMWRDVFLRNRESLLHSLGAYRAALDKLATAVEQSDGATLHKIFTEAKGFRHEIERAGQAGVFDTREAKRLGAESVSRPRNTKAKKKPKTKTRKTVKKSAKKSTKKK